MNTLPIFYLCSPGFLFIFSDFMSLRKRSFQPSCHPILEGFWWGSWWNRCSNYAQDWWCYRHEMGQKVSTLQCPSHSCRNPQEWLRNLQESSGICRNGTGIHRNGTGIELKSSGMRLEHHVYMQIYVYKHLYINIFNRYNTFSFC